MDHLDELDWEILNATADDWESLEQIEHVLPVGLADMNILDTRILRLVESGLLQARFEDTDSTKSTPLKDRTDVRRAWFTMTPNGRAVWTSSEREAEA